MTTITLSTDNSQFVRLFENLANVLNVPFEKTKGSATFSKSMKKALVDENKNAVAEILGMYYVFPNL